MMRVLITGDQELIRESLKIVLSAYPDTEAVGVVSDGAEVLETLPTGKPDAILMNICMPKMDGVSCTRAVEGNYPSIKIIILTTFDDNDFICSALGYGATGYMLKRTSMDDLYDVAVTANEGRATINPDIAAKIFKLFSQMAQSNFAIQIDDDLVHDISRMEWCIIQQVGFGLSNKEITAELYLSEGMVHNCLSNILSKLDSRDRTQLAIWVTQTGVALRSFEDDDHG